MATSQQTGIFNGVRKFEILPINKSSADAVFSYVSGTPVIRFKLAPTAGALVTRNLRFNCEIRIRHPVVGGGLALSPNNTEAATPTPLGSGAIYNVRNDPKTAAIAGIQRIAVSNYYNTSLELIKDVPRLYSSLLGSSYGWGDYSTYLSNMFGASSSTARQAVICSQSEQSLSMPLLAGIFLSSKNIPLGNGSSQTGAGISGICVELTLNPSIAGLFGTDAGTAGGAFVEYRNCTLTGDILLPSSGVLPPIDKFGYNAWNSYYSVLTVRDETVAYNTGLHAVVGGFTNYIPTSNLSNWSRNSQLTLRNMNDAGGGACNTPARMSFYQTLKNGVLFPLKYRLSEQQLRNTVSVQKPNGSYESNRQYYYLNGIKPFGLIKATLSSPISEGLAVGVDTQQLEVAAVTVAAQSGVHFQDQGGQNITAGTGLGTYGGTIYGTGFRFDGLGVKDTTNFGTSTFSYRLQSENDNTCPNSAYTYLLSRNMVSFPAPGQVAVMS